MGALTFMSMALITSKAINTMARSAMMMPAQPPLPDHALAFAQMDPTPASPLRPPKSTHTFCHDRKLSMSRSAPPPSASLEASDMEAMSKPPFDPLG